MNQNGKHRDIGVVDLVEDEANTTETDTFYDSNSPLLKPALQETTGKTRSWKRRLAGWCFILLLIAGGAAALYLLLRVNRVPVRVLADSRRDVPDAKLRGEENSSDNGLTAEAINIARAASGNDTASKPNPNASPNALPAPSPSIDFRGGRDLTFTGNSSPVNERFNDGNPNGDTDQQRKAAALQQPSKAGEFSAAALVQNRANVTQSIFVDDLPPKATIPAQTISSARSDKRTPPLATTKVPTAVLPPFGTMLPVRSQGVIFTLRNSSYARLELTRDCAGSGWALPKGTVLIGRTRGSEADRAFVNVIGYIDPRDNKLVKMTGEVLGSDGAAGIHGKRIDVDRNRLKETLRKVASSGIQVAGMMAGALTGRGTVVIDGAGYRLMNPVSDEARGLIGSGAGRNSFVKVEAGRVAYVMVADLPKSLQAVDAPGEADLAQAAHSLTDREIMELTLFGTPDEIRAATPLMSDEQRRLILKTLEPDNEKR